MIPFIPAVHQSLNRTSEGNYLKQGHRLLRVIADEVL